MPQDISQELPQQKILVVGDFMVDKYFHTNVSRISPEAPVPVAHVQRVEMKLGGAGNVAANVLSLGATVRILTCIGNDYNGDLLIDMLQKTGADVRFIKQVSNFPTIVKTRVVSQGQQLLRYDEENIQDVGDAYVAYLKDNEDAIFQDIDAVILSDYGKGMVTSSLSQAVIATANNRCIPITVDPKGCHYEKYRGASVCTPNLKELTEAAGFTALSEEVDIYNAALQVGIDCGIQSVLVTRSEKGMSLVNTLNQTKQDFSATAREVADVTGAGDTVISVFTLCLAAGFDWRRCCTIANAAAGIVVTKFGAAAVSIQELAEVLHQSSATGKIVTGLSNMEQIAKGLHNKGKRIVFTNGCFDLVHAGHIASFRKAKAQGDVLIVGVNSDTSIKAIKGNMRPIVDEQNRIALLEAIECIDYVVLFKDETPQQLIEKILPDVLVKGRDWEGKTVVGQDIVETHGGYVYFVDLEEGLSTTAIIQKVIEVYK